MRRCVFVQYTNAAGYPPLVHASRILAERGWEVLVLQSPVGGAASLRQAAHARIRTLSFTRRLTGFAAKFHFAAFTLWCVFHALRWRAAWAYVSDAPAALAGFLLAASGVRAVYHEHDAPAPPFSGAMRAALRFRRALVRRAAACVIPNQARAASFAADTGRTDVLVVWNCPSVHEVAPERGEPAGGLRVLYQGSVVPERLPVAAVDALALLPPSVTLEIVGYETAGSAGYVRRLELRAAEKGVASRLAFRGPLNRAELLERCRAADVGLALMPRRGDENMRRMAGASNKVFEYLASGAALLVTDLPEWEECYVRPGYARACDPDSAESVAGALKWFLDHPRQTRAMGEAGRIRVAAEWNYEKTFAPVLERMENACSR